MNDASEGRCDMDNGTDTFESLNQIACHCVTDNDVIKFIAKV